MPDQKPSNPLFRIGRVVTTTGAMEACSREYLMECLARHATGDWGLLHIEDRESNNDAAKNGGRILSSYPIDSTKPSKGHGANTLWIITEANRSITTFLLPDEY